MIKTDFMIPDDLTIPAFLRRKPGEKRYEPKHVVVIEEEKPIPTTTFIPTVLPKKKKINKGKREPVNIQERIRAKASWHIAELEGMIDDGMLTPEWSLYDHARKQEWSTPVAKLVAEHFVPRANELLEVISMTDDADLQYAYRGYDADDITNMAVTFQSLVDESIRWADHAKLLKPRKKKLPSMERVLKHFVYAKTDDTYKLVSIDPVKIIGSQELWVFHPKSNVLTVFRAIDRGGLNIKRTKIMNYDEKNSFAKRIGRKTHERLETVLNGGKVTLRKLMDSINGDSLKLTRITKYHILLRVE